MNGSNGTLQTPDSRSKLAQIRFEPWHRDNERRGRFTWTPQCLTANAEETKQLRSTLKFVVARERRDPVLTGRIVVRTKFSNQGTIFTDNDGFEIWCNPFLLNKEAAQQLDGITVVCLNPISDHRFVKRR